MKRITCDFSLLDFDEGTLLTSYNFTPALLSIRVKFYGTRTGQGKAVQFIPIPEASLFFRDVTFCQRVVRALDKKTGIFEEPATEKESLPEKQGDTNTEFVLKGNSAQPSGHVQWRIRAQDFEMELGDDILGRLSEAGFVFHFC